MMMQNFVVDLDIAVFTHNATFYKNGLICIESHKRQENLFCLRMSFFLFKSVSKFFVFLHFSFFAAKLQQNYDKLLLFSFMLMFLFLLCVDEKKIRKNCYISSNFFVFHPRWQQTINILLSFEKNFSLGIIFSH